MVQLLCACAHYEQPVPQLWSTLLPHLAGHHAGEHSSSGSSGGSSWEPQQLLRLLMAARTVAPYCGPGELQQLLRLADAALQQLGCGASLAGVELASVATLLLQAAARQQLAQQLPAAQQCALSVQQHADALVARLVPAVVRRPQLLPWRGLLQLLQAAVQLQGLAAAGGSTGGNRGDAARGAVSVPTQQLRQLADLAMAHPQHWQPVPDPASLVTLLQCHTQPPLAHARLADSYADELLPLLPQCSVQTLVSLLGVLGAAMQPQQQQQQQQHSHCRGYSNSRLATAAARQLRGKLVQASRPQLAAARAALQQLHQQQDPLCAALERLLAKAAKQGHV
jgi:hypothetical protein